MSTTPAERLRIALELSGVGEEMVRTRLRRENPDLNEAELQAEIARWLQHRPGAPFGDHPGRVSRRVLGPAD